MSARAYTAKSTFHLNPEAFKGFGTTTALVLLLLLVYLGVQPRIDLVQVRMATVHAVQTFSLRTTPPAVRQTGVSTGSGEGASATVEVASTQPPQTLKMAVPIPVEDPGLGGNIFDPQDPGLLDGRGGQTNGPARGRFGSVDVAAVDHESPADDAVFEYVEIDPQIDLEALRHAIVYPEMARRNGIEGQVIVKALVKQDGSVGRVEVFRSTNAKLDQAAINGVRAARFMPGKQNGKAVSCWIYVPVSFTLSKR